MWSKFKNISSEICCNPGVLEIIFIFYGFNGFQLLVMIELVWWIFAGEFQLSPAMLNNELK